MIGLREKTFKVEKTHPRVIGEVQRFEGQRGQEIDEKPPLQVMHCYQFRLCDDAARLLINISRSKVDDNVYDEEHLDNGVCDYKLLRAVVRFERHVEGNHDCDVAHKQKDDPVPYQARPTEVQDHEARQFGVF